MRIAKDKKQVNVIMPIVLVERVKLLADKEQRSVSQMIMILTQEAIEQREGVSIQNQNQKNIE